MDFADGALGLAAQAARGDTRSTPSPAIGWKARKPMLLENGTYGLRDLTRPKIAVLVSWVREYGRSDLDLLDEVADGFEGIKQARHIDAEQ
jgi:hypothetical protein